MADRHEEGYYEKNIPTNFVVCNGLSNDDVGVARGTVFEEIRSGAGFKTDDSVKETLGGGTVDRLACRLELIKMLAVTVMPVHCFSRLSLDAGIS